MNIIISIKQDKRGDAYWSAMLVHENNVMLEVHSQTFNAFKRYDKWNEYTKVCNRMAIELMNEGGMAEQKTIARMLMTNPELERTENTNERRIIPNLD
jgi:hypothetical protein